jgi:hypothetical protein
MQPLLLLVACLCLCLSSCSLAWAQKDRNVVPASVTRGIVDGRSPDVLVALADSLDGLTGQVLLSSPNAARWLSTSGVPVEDVHVSDVSLRALNLLPTHKRTFAPAFLKTHPLSHARASAMVVIQGMSAETVQQSSLQAGAAVSVPLETRSFRADFTARLASLATGQPPRVHGVPSAQWVDPETGEIVFAYQDVAPSVPASLADAVQWAECVSYEPSAAQAMCAASASQDTATSVRVVDRSASVDVDAFLADGRIQEAFAAVTGVSTVVQFDNAASVSFWAELEFMWRVVGEQSVQEDAARTRSYAFVLTGLERVAAEVGRDSPAFHVYESVVAAFVKALLREVARIEQDSVINQVVVLQSQPAVPSVQVQLPLIATDVPGALYAQDRDPANAVVLCHEAVKAAKSHSGLHVYCFARDGQARASNQEKANRRRLLASDGAQATLGAGAGGEVKPADVQRWQIAAWLSIFMAFVLYFALYSVGFMELKQDSLLYSVLPSE